MVRLAMTVVVSLFVVACGGGASPTRAPATQAPATQAAASSVANATAGTGGLPAGDQLCALLTADDWTQAGVSGAGQPHVNSDGPGSAYCSYTGTSGAQGGLEFDAFANASTSDAQATYETAAGEAGATEQVALPLADQAAMDSADSPGVLVVRKGRFTYVISLPPSDSSQAQLATLAALVMGRASALE